MKPKIIFFGNGPLAKAVKSTLAPHVEFVYHAHTAEDLETVKTLKIAHPELKAVLASFGVLIKSDLLELFEPEGILNVHPSLLPKYRGASPIESAILNGDTDFSVSIMKLVKKMDAGPIYYQETLKNLPLNKSVIYEALAKSGANWLIKNLNNLPAPKPQDDSAATFTQKLEKSMGILTPESDSAKNILRKIIAFQDFPKVRYTFYEKPCLILSAHLLKLGETAPLTLTCADGQSLAIDRLQPENKRPMDAQSFLNGYGR